MRYGYNVSPNIAFPTPPYTCDLAEYTIEAVPLLLSGLELRIRMFVREPNDDIDRAIQEIRKLQVMLLTGCSSQIVEALDRQYRLLDRAVNGTIYITNGIDPITQKPVIVPALPLVPAGPAVSLSVRLTELLDSQNNLTDGTRELLRQILLNSANDDQQIEDVLTALQAILAIL